MIVCFFIEISQIWDSSVFDKKIIHSIFLSNFTERVIIPRNHQIRYLGMYPKLDLSYISMGWGICETGSHNQFPWEESRK